jgi:matrixin
MLKLAAALLTSLLALASQADRGNILDNREAIPYFIEDGKGVSGYLDSDRELARLAFEAWSRESGSKLKFTEAGAATSALVRLRWISPTQGLYGETQRVRVNGRTGAVVNVMPQVAAQGEPLAGLAARDALLRDTIVYLTCVHELGHAVGLPHTARFEDIMYYFGFGGDIVDYFTRYRNKLKSRADITKFSGLSAGDIQALRVTYP